MRHFLSAAIMAGTAIALGSPAKAELANTEFLKGSTGFQDWTRSGDVTRVTAVGGFTESDMMRQGGEYFAALQSTLNGSTLRQVFTTEGGVLEGDVGWIANGFFPDLDYGLVYIRSLDGSFYRELLNVSVDPAKWQDLEVSGWTAFSVYLAPGTYEFYALAKKVEPGSITNTDSTPSLVAVSFDTFQRVGAVPEPATWAIMLAGFFGLGAALRWRRRQRRIAPLGS
jgi:hypothetical protein